jgi:cysteine-rich repeat protein
VSLLLDDACGDGVVDAGEECDDGNTTSDDGCSSDCRVETFGANFVSLPGQVLQVKDPGGPGLRRMKVASIAARIDPAAFGDLVGTGAVLQLFNDAGTGESACLTLAPSGWSVRGSGTSVTYKYRDARFASGPCNAASIKRGKVKIACRGDAHTFPFSLDEPQQRTLAIRFTSGSIGYCLRFGGTTLMDAGTSLGGAGIFAARDAQATDCASTVPTCR